ncbi:unnamed protein product, partial [Urochloa humidicola]
TKSRFSLSPILSSPQRAAPSPLLRPRRRLSLSSARTIASLSSACADAASVLYSAPAVLSLPLLPPPPPLSLSVVPSPCRSSGARDARGLRAHGSRGRAGGAAGGSRGERPPVLGLAAPRAKVTRGCQEEGPVGARPPELPRRRLPRLDGHPARSAAVHPRCSNLGLDLGFGPWRLLLCYEITVHPPTAQIVHR